MTPHPARAVVIGASAGGVQALLALLPSLPADFALPILVVLHVPADRSNVLAPLFASKCALTVKEAEDKEPVEPGVVYFAPSDYHLLVEADGALALSSDELVNYSRPSIDVLFESAADAYSLKTVNLPDALASALVKTAEYRNPRPNAVEEFFFYSHPSVERRVRAAMEWKAAHPAAGPSASE